MESNQSLFIDRSKIKMAVKDGLPVTVTATAFSHDIQECTDSLLKDFLAETDSSELSDSLSYCLRELSDNAFRANFKRVYFEEKHIDINDKYEYRDGLKEFKEELARNFVHYQEAVSQKGLFVKMTVQIVNQTLMLEVRNHADLLVWEYKRMHDRITRAQQYKAVEHGMEDVIDNTEGAGLGLLIMILVLKKLGLSEENFTIESSSGETVTRLLLPYSSLKVDKISHMTSEFVDLIEGLPVFPENITRINSLIQSEEASVADVANLISSDVGLTGELLKIINSASYGLGSPCSSVNDAVAFMGLKGVQNMLFSIGTMRIFNSIKENEKRRLWGHSSKVAFFTVKLAEIFYQGEKYRDFRGNAYVCGLLHDIGKLVFETAHPESMRKINAICRSHDVQASFFENLVAGANHTGIGYLVACKWNFPDIIKNTIRYHHDCLNSPSSAMDMTVLVYTADVMVHILDKDIEFYQINSDYIKKLGLSSEEAFRNLAEKISCSFSECNQPRPA